MINLSKLKEVRKRLGLTQKDLAIEANVSQSLIAKVEAGYIDPSYSNALKIEEAIRARQQTTEKRLADVMVKNVISADKDAKVDDVVQLMLKEEISQLPVTDQGDVIGMITETSILENRGKHFAEDIMTDAPPAVSENTNLSAAMELLKFCPMIIAKKKGTITGVLTKADVLKEL